jgi:uncharacterized oligopeptide transporter (OPT) family protein
MKTEREQAMVEFRRMMKWIVLLGVLMVIGALTYLGLTGEMYANMVVATILGVFFSIALGCGLFAAAFFSEKSGHDQDVTDASKSERDKH